MKVMTALLVGVAMLVSSVAGAQYYAQASVSGLVLSYGPAGFMLQGPDGNYGIVVTTTTVVTDPWNRVVMTGPGNVLPGDYVTATGYPTSQWTMRATLVVVRNVNPPVVYQTYGSTFETSPAPGVDVVAAPVKQGVTYFNAQPSASYGMIDPYALHIVRG